MPFNFLCLPKFAHAQTLLAGVSPTSAYAPLHYLHTIQPAHQVLAPQVGIAPEHLHRFMSTDCRYLLVGKPGLDKTTDRLVPQVMKVQIRHACSGLLIPDTDLGENPRRERGV